MVTTFFFILAFVVIVIALLSCIKIAKHVDRLEQRVKHLEHKTRRMPANLK